MLCWRSSRRRREVEGGRWKFEVVLVTNAVVCTVESHASRFTIIWNSGAKFHDKSESASLSAGGVVGERHVSAGVGL